MRDDIRTQPEAEQSERREPEIEQSAAQRDPGRAAAEPEGDDEPEEPEDDDDTDDE